VQELFEKLLPGKTLHPYQERVANLLLAGNNVILRAPTGAGKTWAALLPFLYSYTKDKSIADRLLYALPMRTLATSLHADALKNCQQAFGEARVASVGKDRDYRRKDLLRVTIQTGEQKDDPFFEGDIIFTTIDQLLSSYLMMPVSLPERVGNINAGALLGALIVFDEFHLLDPDKAMGTAIEMMDRLRPFSRFLIMTATLSNGAIGWLAKKLDTKVECLDSEEVKQLPSHKEKHRIYRWAGKPLTAEAVLQVHNGGRSIVLVNTVSRAQSLYKELVETLKQFGWKTKLEILHSRYFPEHRKEKESLLNSWFGPEAVETDVILVTTQVIEAGMDLSADNLHTEIAPMNSLIQRAGRCARYGGKRGIGTVWIYELMQDSEGGLRLGPYRYNESAALIDMTRNALRKLPEHGKEIDFDEEVRWIQEVHAESEEMALSSYDSLYSRRETVHKAMDGRNRAAIRELIRESASINVLITPQPEKLQFNKNRWPQLLSVPRYSLLTLSPFFKNLGPDKWVAKVPELSDQGSDFYFEWKSIPDATALISAPWLVVIHPDYAYYSGKLGLVLGESGTVYPVLEKDKPPLPRYQYRYEPYKAHVKRIMDQYREMLPSMRVILKCLSEHFQANQQEIERLGEVACALHDVGKLSLQWQQAIWAWQGYKDKMESKPPKERVPLAHSDYDPESDWLEQKRFLRPPHAAEGAYAVGDLLIRQLGEKNAAVIWTAIARHHGTHTSSLSEFSLIENAFSIATNLLPEEWQTGSKFPDLPKRTDRDRFSDDLLCFSSNDKDELLWPLYVYVVRCLRLSDQGSQDWGK